MLSYCQFKTIYKIIKVNKLYLQNGYKNCGVGGDRGYCIEAGDKRKRVFLNHNRLGFRAHNKETCFTSVTTKLSVSEFKKQHLIQKAPPLYIRIFHNPICLNIHKHTTTLRCWKDICYDKLYTKDNTLDIGEHVTHTTRGSCCRLFRRLLSSF